MSTDTWYRHDMKTVRDIMITCIGLNFGPNPEEKLEEIRDSRYKHGLKIAKRLKIDENDVVADIGSGCGFVTRAACERAREVHCIDISQEFLDFTKVELQDFDNTKFHKIDYASFPDIADATIDKVFSTAVFIHFYYYDFIYNLIEVNRILKTGGIFYTEIVDSDVLQLESMRAIKTHVGSYKHNRGKARLIQPFSLTALKNLSAQLGFKLVESTQSADVAEVTLKKVADAQIPEWLEPHVNA